MKKGLILVGSIIVICTIHACRKKDTQTATETYSPTAMSVTVPAYAAKYVGNMPVSGTNPMTAEGVDLGHKLFYDKTLSNDRTISCASCHKQENAFDDPRPFSQGTNGSFGDRNAMAIINLGWNTRFFWDGRRASLEGQAHDPVTNPIEMANNWSEVVKRLQNNTAYPDLFFKAFGTRTIDSNLVVNAISQFERTLVSFNSRFDHFYFEGDSTALTAQEQRGLAIFVGDGKCKNCHLMNTLFTDHEFRNNGLDANPKDDGLMKFTGNAADKGKFKVPTLRNIAVTAPYMHDSRFTTLEEVVDFYSSKIQQTSPNLDEHMPEFGSGLNLTTQQKADLVAFLKSLTDEDFIRNPKFSDPN